MNRRFPRLRRVATATTLAASTLLTPALLVPSAQAGSPTPSDKVAARIGNTDKLSQGARAWLNGSAGQARAQAQASQTPRFGTNVDANDPARDLAAGQSETAIGAQRAGTQDRLLVGWNDATAFYYLNNPTDPRSSITNLGLSRDGGRTFTDLGGLPNNNIDQEWFGDPAIAALGDGSHFAVASLYFPSSRACSDGLPAQATIALTIVTVLPNAVRYTAPLPVARAGDLCRFSGDVSLLDKDWVSYDPASRTLAVSYTRFRFGQSSSGLGQIEVVRATVPSDPTTLSAAQLQAPTVVWREEPFCPQDVPSSEFTQCGAVNQGAYVSVASGGNAYVAWERNINSNQFNGDPYVYLHAAFLPAGGGVARGGRGNPVVISAGQPNGSPDGLGTKSITGFPIPGFNRFLGNDFPRVAINPKTNTPVFAWNDSSLHPLGDIWLRPAGLGLRTLGTTQKVNDDASYALHFLPAVSVRSDGTVCTSWYDRRRYGATSALTDYFAECRATPATPAKDVAVTTGSTDWANTSSFIVPNFGDYTDNVSVGTSTYFTWSDGRVGIPQPFVDHR